MNPSLDIYQRLNNAGRFRPWSVIVRPAGRAGKNETAALAIGQAEKVLT
jgi:hypothetical protein